MQSRSGTGCQSKGQLFAPRLRVFLAHLLTFCCCFALPLPPYPASHLTFVFAKRLARDCVVCTNGSKSHQLIGRTRNRMRLPRGEPEEKERKILEALHWCSYFRCERERSVKGMNFQSIDLLSGRQEMLLTFICPHCDFHHMI